MKVPPAPAFAGAVEAVRTPPVIKTQAEWLFLLKGGCETCHQMGEKSTREIPANLGTFGSSKQAWERLISSGQVGREMMSDLDSFGHKRAGVVCGLGRPDRHGRTSARAAPASRDRPKRGDYNVGLVGADCIPERSHQHR